MPPENDVALRLLSGKPGRWATGEEVRMAEVDVDTLGQALMLAGQQAFRDGLQKILPAFLAKGLDQHRDFVTTETGLLFFFLCQSNRGCCSQKGIYFSSFQLVAGEKRPKDWLDVVMSDGTYSERVHFHCCVCPLARATYGQIKILFKMHLTASRCRTPLTCGRSMKHKF